MEIYEAYLKGDLEKTLTLRELIEFSIQYDGDQGRYPEHQYEGFNFLRTFLSEKTMIEDADNKVKEKLSKQYKDEGFSFWQEDGWENESN